MSVTIHLPPDVEAEVATQAKVQGVSIEDYLPRLIQSALPQRQTLSSLHQGEQDWLALLHQSPPVTIGGLGVTDDALRRENLYEDRG